MELWTKLNVSVNDDGVITIEKDGRYDWDEDGHEIIVYDDFEVADLFDLYAAVANTLSGVEIMDENMLGYGEYWFVAIEGGEHGYVIDKYKMDELNEEGLVQLYPLSDEWADEIKQAIDGMFCEA
jgi:hypothetical protein